MSSLPLSSTQIDAPSPGQCADTPLDVCCAAGTLLQNAAGFTSGVLDGGKGAGGSALRSGCCREHPLIGAGHRDFIYWCLLANYLWGVGKSSVDQTGVHLLGLSGGRA